jgi:hypothetical protein
MCRPKDVPGYVPLDMVSVAARFPNVSPALHALDQMRCVTPASASAVAVEVGPSSPATLCFVEDPFPPRRRYDAATTVASNVHSSGVLHVVLLVEFEEVGVVTVTSTGWLVVGIIVNAVLTETDFTHCADPYVGAYVAYVAGSRYVSKIPAWTRANLVFSTSLVWTCTLLPSLANYVQGAALTPVCPLVWAVGGLWFSIRTCLLVHLFVGNVIRSTVTPSTISPGHARSEIESTPETFVSL